MDQNKIQGARLGSVGGPVTGLNYPINLNERKGTLRLRALVPGSHQRTTASVTPKKYTFSLQWPEFSLFSPTVYISFSPISLIHLSNFFQYCLKFFIRIFQNLLLVSSNFFRKSFKFASYFSQILFKFPTIFPTNVSRVSQILF